VSGGWRERETGGRWWRFIKSKVNLLLAQISAYVITSPLWWAKNKIFNPSISVYHRGYHQPDRNFALQPSPSLLLRIETAVDRERRSTFPPSSSPPAPQGLLITEYHPDVSRQTRVHAVTHRTRFGTGQQSHAVRPNPSGWSWPICVVPMPLLSGEVNVFSRPRAFGCTKVP